MDLVERKQAEEEMARLTAILENTSDLVSTATPDSRLTYLNAAGRRMAGWGLDEDLTGHTIADFHPSWALRIIEQEALEAARRKGIWQGDTAVLHRDGHEIPVSQVILSHKSSDGVLLYYSTIIRDITERKRAELALRESEERYRGLFTAMQEMFALHEIICDADGRPQDYRYLEVNTEFERATGIPRERWIGHTVREVLPQVEEHWIQGFGEVALTGVARNFKNYVKELDRHYEVVAYSPKRGQFAIIALNVTERKRTEEKLIASEERFRKLIEQASDGFELLDEQGSYVDANSASCWQLGYSKEELLRLNVTDIDPLVTRERFQEIFRSIIGEPPIIFETTHRRKDGSEFPVEIAASIVEFQASRYSLALVRDITERKRADMALRESEERWRTIIETEPECVKLLDREGRLLDMNPAGLGMIQARLDQVLGQKVVGLVAKEDQPAFKEMIEAVFRGETRHLVFGMVGLEGRRLTLETTSAPLKDTKPTGGVRALLGVTRDITERMQAEKEREKLQAQLTQAQKLESVGRLAGGVAHDFNNMLQAILGNVDLALIDLPTESPLRASLEEIKQSAHHSADLTRQLLGFARKQTVVPKVLDLNRTVEEMLNMLRRLIGENISLVWIPGRDLGSVKVDPSQIDQILANLCVNARDAIGDVGKITIQTDSVAFDDNELEDILDQPAGDYVRLAVSDTGSGMDKEVLAHLFEPFFTTKAMGKGTGLGLATVYGIVKQNGGFIRVKSEPGQGTTFQICLPRYLAKADRAETEVPAQQTGGSETILLVEDEPAILRVGERTLKRLGYRVLTASTPGEAIRLAEQHAGEIHLLMTDVVMPEMNGRDLAKRLLALYPHLKRLFISGYTAEVIAHRGVVEEGVHFLQKPFTMQSLADKVRAALSSA